MIDSHPYPAASPTIRVHVAGESQTWEFDRAFTIGRGEENDVVIKDTLVSQQHARVHRAGHDWQISDLESTNGIFLAGDRVERAPLHSQTEVRLGYAGPTLRFTLLHADGQPRDTVAMPPRVSVIAERYFGPEPPANMSERTAKMRRIAQQQRRQHTKKYRLAVGLLALVAVATGGFAYWQHREVERQRAAAAELFYAAKALELEVAQLQLSAEERQSYRARRAELDQQYQQFVEALGLYDDDKSDEVQLVYRVIHRFGESEVNAPREFVDEVLRYVDRWKRSNELEVSIARANELDYSRRIASIFLEHDLPPDFYYLALQESRFKVDAVGPPTRFGYAKGMWQFLASTGRAYGLRPGPLVGQPRPDPLDERHDFEKSTRAAARYLYDIYTTDAQASGLLVIASYNWGQTNMLRLIRSMPESPRERNFWNLHEQYGDRIPRETYGYVFRIVAAAVIGEDPARFGFGFEPPLPPLQPDASPETGPVTD